MYQMIVARLQTNVTGLEYVEKYVKSLEELLEISEERGKLVAILAQAIDVIHTEVHPEKIGGFLLSANEILETIKTSKRTKGDLLNATRASSNPEENGTPTAPSKPAKGGLLNATRPDRDSEE